MARPFAVSAARRGVLRRVTFPRRPAPLGTGIPPARVHVVWPASPPRPALIEESATMAGQIGIMETVLRDAHQCLVATRMRTDDMLPIAAALDDVGYWSLETWGGRHSTPR